MDHIGDDLMHTNKYPSPPFQPGPPPPRQPVEDFGIQNM
jgi:hypothetical protein